MIVHCKKILVHLDTSFVRIYRLKDRKLELLSDNHINFRQSFVEMLTQIDAILYGLNEFSEVINNECIRLYATGDFQKLSQSDQSRLIIHCFVNHSLCLNIVEPELERFYLEKSLSSQGTKSLIDGLICQEFKSVVICGSFEHSLPYMEDVIERLKKHDIKILSPLSTKVKPETIGSNFILFDYQDGLKNERDTWRHKYEHMDKFRQSDAIIVCNPNGIIGSEGTIFEFGFMIALSKRIIFTEKPIELSVIFPYEVGLNF